MSSFDLAIPIILKHEGGYSNQKGDSGGHTNYGITLQSLKLWERGDLDKDGDIDVDDLKSIRRSVAIKYYKDQWWDRYNYDNIPSQILATKIFDFSINMGAKRSHKLLQESLNSCGENLVVDGLIGQKTFQAINNISMNILPVYSWAAYSFYVKIAYKYPKNIKFLKGWKNRAFSIREE